MPIVRVDLSEAQSLKPIPDDTYTFRIIEVKGPNKGAKASYLTFILEITDGDFAGRKIYHNLMIDGAAAGMFADFLTIITGEEIDVDELDSYELDTDDLLGQEIDAVVKQEEYPEGSGDFRSKIAKFV